MDIMSWHKCNLDTNSIQRVTDNVLKELQNKICLQQQIDDIIIFPTNLQDLRKLSTKLQEAEFKIQENKSEFLNLLKW